MLPTVLKVHEFWDHWLVDLPTCSLWVTRFTNAEWAKAVGLS